MSWLDQLAQGGTNGNRVQDEQASGRSVGGGLDGLPLDEIVSKLGDGNRLLAQLITALNDLSPRATNSFTMDAAASKVITDANVASSSFVVLTPMNAQAATLQASTDALYWTVASGQFTVSTAAGGSAAGTEVFAYAVFTSLG